MVEPKQQFSEKVHVWLPLLLAVVLVVGMMLGIQIAGTKAPVVVEEVNPHRSLSGEGKIEELLRYIEAKYVDEVDRDVLVQEAIDRILEQLDPHSSFIPSDILREANEELEGNF